MKPVFMLVVAGLLVVTGCGTPSYEAGGYDRDPYRTGEGEPSSLFEMSFGDGETEVTKNLPADAAQRLGETMKSFRGSSPPDITGE